MDKWIGIKVNLFFSGLRLIEGFLNYRR